MNVCVSVCVVAPWQPAAGSGRHIRARALMRLCVFLSGSLSFWQPTAGWACARGKSWARVQLLQQLFSLAGPVQFPVQTGVNVCVCVCVWFSACVPVTPSDPRPESGSQVVQSVAWCLCRPAAVWSGPPVSTSSPGRRECLCVCVCLLWLYLHVTLSADRPSLQSSPVQFRQAGSVVISVYCFLVPQPITCCAAAHGG